MSRLKFIFRADKTNVGDWWCAPSRYFPFRPGVYLDVCDPQLKIENTDTIIVGGGGLGTEYFRPFLKKIDFLNPKTSILWGAGVDKVSNASKLLGDDNSKQDLYGDYFNFFDEVGIRVFSNPQKFRYVPCVSCMNNLFFEYRDVKPKVSIGFYNHKRSTLLSKNNDNGIPVLDNDGDNIEEKLRFLSSCEYIVTNTYHGVYWATLLERKVICVPFKSGLFSFKYLPAYSFNGELNDDLFINAKKYKSVLEEARKLNLEFYNYLTSKYDLV